MRKRDVHKEERRTKTSEEGRKKQKENKEKRKRLLNPHDSN